MMAHELAGISGTITNDEFKKKLIEWDRITLADVRKEWADYQSIRARHAVYRYLHQVFMQVDWWSRFPEEKEQELQAFLEQNPNIILPPEPYAAVILATADPKKVDRRMRSKWARALRYAAEYKPPKELLRDFLQRKGGINKCAARYTRRLGRQRDRKSKKTR
jgi:hypothetical protein